MISRTLKDCELNYAIKERKLLAIIWAIGKLKKYLYGAQEICIFTDHQPWLSLYPSEIIIQKLNDGTTEHGAKVLQAGKGKFFR